MFKRITAFVNSIAQWLREDLETRREQREPEGFVADAAQPWRIEDGVGYTLPIVVPQGILDMAKQTQRPDLVLAFIREAYPQYKSQWSDPYYQHEPFSMLELSSPLKEWSHSTRVEVLEQCHLAWERNPLANAAVTFNRLFAVQNGQRRSYRSEAVRDAVEAFCANPENDVETQDKELLDTLQVDGELFLEFHGADADNGQPGELIMTSIPAWGVRAIQCELGFVRRPTFYDVSYTQDAGVGTGGAQSRYEAIPASRILHIAINKKSYEQRGRPELLRVLPYLGGYREWLENRGRQNHYRGTIVYDVTLNNATPAQVSAKRSQYKEPPRGASIAVHNQNEMWQVLEGKINASDAAEDGRQMKLMIAAGLRVPEYMLADGANANLASATAQQMPALRSFAEWQDIMGTMWRKVYWRVLEAAGMELDAEIDEERFDGEAWIKTGKKIKVRDAVGVKYPELESSDPKNLTDALTIAVSNEWMSNETAANTLPFDLNYEEEQRKIEAEMERERDMVSQGLKPDPMAFLKLQNNPNGANGDNGNGSQQDSGDEQPTNQQQPDKQAA